jgi:hypothetical protein
MMSALFNVLYLDIAEYLLLKGWVVRIEALTASRDRGEVDCVPKLYQIDPAIQSSCSYMHRAATFQQDPSRM